MGADDDDSMEEGIYEAEDDMDNMDMDGDMPSNEDLEMMIKNILDQEIAALIDAGKLEAGDDYEKDEEGGADEEELDVDAEAELTNIMSEYISMEIDLEVLDMLIEDAAAGTEYWSAISNQVIANNGTFSTSSYYNTQGQWFQTLGTKIQKLSNKIHQLTLRGGANFLTLACFGLYLFIIKPNL